MLLRQENFPHTYENKDIVLMVDHDRLLDHNSRRVSTCFQKHTGIGECGLEDWIRRASTEACINFLKDVLEADASRNWTGFRVLGSVHRGNGYPVWTLCLFAKHPESKTEVYSGQDAPNVRGFQVKDHRITSAVARW